MDTYINTTEGWNIAARYGLTSTEYRLAKKKWEQMRIIRARYWVVKKAHA